MVKSRHKNFKIRMVLDIRVPFEEVLYLIVLQRRILRVIVLRPGDIIIEHLLAKIIVIRHLMHLIY
jgi:hypothetical protein